MKRLVLSLALAALAAIALRAQDNHHGPVVYPANTSPESESTVATNAAPAAPVTSLASNATPAAPDSGPVTLPPLDASPATTSPANEAPATQPTVNSPPPAHGMPVTPPASSIPTPIVAPNTTSPASSSAPVLAPLQGLSSAVGAPNGGKPDDIYDIRPPYFYLKPITWLWLLLGVPVLIALAVLLWIWLKPTRVLRAKTAYELALEKLEKARALLNEQNPEPYAVLVSETIRSYLGQRFQTPSTRRTTEEFLRQMQADTSTPLAEHRDLLRQFLEACDLVKFAHYEPGREELEQVQQRAVSFVTATRPLEGAPA